MNEALEKYTKGNVYFVEYSNDCLWFEAGRHSSDRPIIFPVPVADLSTGTKYLACDRAIYFHPYIEHYLGSLA